MPQTLASIALIAAGTSNLNPRAFMRMNPTKLSIAPLRFIMKMAIVRFFVDLGFYAGHRVLHHRKLYWIHHYHHSHYKPVLGTNFHFSALDIIVEASMPVILGFGALELLGIKTSQLEKTIMVGYIGWHEQGSHCGKQ